MILDLDVKVVIAHLDRMQDEVSMKKNKQLEDRKITLNARYSICSELW